MRGLPLTRRDTLKSLTAAGALLALGPLGCAGKRPVHFLHGVASGDPLQDRVILWTRVQPEDGKAVAVRWEVARDAGFEEIAAEGTAEAAHDTDFIVKADAAGLEPGLPYFYRFTAEEQRSPTGQTRTLPEGDVGSFKLAVMSCSHYAAGFFNVYKTVAEREDVDAVLHLGDYIYEYGMDGYGGPIGQEIDRIVEPDREILTLADYRARYGHYRLDADLQALHAAKPMIAIWDDHETANNTWKNGAQNHDEETEGPYRARAEASLKAYLEWLPIRKNEDEPERIYRSFDIGNLARLIMLDTRRIGRDKQLSFEDDMPRRRWPFDVSEPSAPVALAEGEDPGTRPVEYFEVPFNMRTDPPTPVTDLAYAKTLNPEALPDGLAYLPDPERFKAELLNDESRSMLGAEQEAWAAAEIQSSAESGQTWQVLGQQVVMGRAPAADLMDVIDWSKMPEERRPFFEAVAWRAEHGLPFSLDSWDGYPPARARLYSQLTQHARNALVLAGDTHNSWAFNLQDETGKAVGAEFACPSVTSPGIEYWVPGDPDAIAARYIPASPDLVWADTSHRGYTLVTLTPDAAEADWFFVSTVKARDFDVRRAKSFRVRTGLHRLEAV